MWVLFNLDFEADGGGEDSLSFNLATYVRRAFQVLVRDEVLSEELISIWRVT